MSDPQISLTFLDAASDLLEQSFQLTDGALDGAQFGLAATAPMPADVSEPATLGASAGLIGLLMYRRRVK